MSEPGKLRIVDIDDASTFARVPACADARFDHRSCDYWEDEVRGSKASRPQWWRGAPATPLTHTPRPVSDNPFAPPQDEAPRVNPFSRTSEAAVSALDAGDDALGAPAHNPFAPAPEPDRAVTLASPRKLRLLSRGTGVSGSYAKALLLDDEPVVYAQFGPLSAYPRAQRIRELYPKLPQSPLPATITCIATTREARGRGLAAHLVMAICEDLSSRGFSAAEAYPDLALGVDERSAADPGFWHGCRFSMVADDERYPVMRRELD